MLIKTKNPHRIIAAAIALAVISPLSSVFAGTAEAAGAWDCESLPSGSSYVNAEENELEMYFSSNDNEGKANAEREYDLSANSQICISFDSEISTADSSAVRRLNIQNSSLKSTEIINITGSALEVFGNETEINTEPGRKYTFDIGIEPQSGYGAVYLDGAEIFSGGLGSKWKSFDYSSINVLFRNTSASRSSTLESRWLVSNYSLTDKMDGFTALPQDGETFVDSALENIEIRFNGIKSPSVYGADNYTLTAGGTEVPVSAQRNGNTVYIAPQNGFEPSTDYVLTIKAVSDIFGNIESENQTVSFATAEDGYESAKVSISAESETVYDSEGAYIAVSSSASSGIMQTVIYSNGAVYKTFDGAVEGFDFTAGEGRYTIYAEVTDGYGGKARSEEITINVLHNDAPAVTVNGVAEGMTYEASKLTAVEISAADPDGTVISLTAEINGSVYELDPNTSNTIDLSALAPDMYTLAVTAVDNADAVTVREIRFTVLEGYTTTNVFSSDFNSYTSDGTTNPGLTFTRNGDAQLIASKDYGEEHGTVVLLKTDGGEVAGQTAQGTWGRIVTSNTTDGFIIKMDINLLNSDGYFYLMLKHPTQSPLAMDVQIKACELTLNNSGSVAVRRDLTPGEWYTFVYRVDLKNHKYWFTLDDEMLADEFNVGNASITQADTRLVMEFVDRNTPTPCGIAFDNLTVDYITPITQITGITGDDGEAVSRISPYTNTLNVIVNTELQQSSLNRESVRLWCGDERVYYDSLSYDSSSRTITLNLSEKLRSDHDYTVELTNSVSTSSGAALTGGLKGGFSVDYYDVDVSELSVSETNGNIKASGSIINTGGASGKCYVIVNAYNGLRLVGTHVQEVAYGRTGETSFETAALNAPDASRAEVYVWSSLTAPKPLPSRIFSFDL